MSEQPKQPWELWTPKERAHVDNLMTTLEHIQQYKSNPGVFGQFAPEAMELARRGGLSPDEATILGRYRMYKSGSTDIPTGPAVPLQEGGQAERDAFFASSPEGRDKLWEQNKEKAKQSEQLFYHDLVPPSVSLAPDKRNLMAPTPQGAYEQAPSVYLPQPKPQQLPSPPSPAEQEDAMGQQMREPNFLDQVRQQGAWPDTVPDPAQGG